VFDLHEFICRVCANPETGDGPPSRPVTGEGRSKDWEASGLAASMFETWGSRPRSITSGLAALPSIRDLNMSTRFLLALRLFSSWTPSRCLLFRHWDRRPYHLQGVPPTGLVSLSPPAMASLPAPPGPDESKASIVVGVVSALHLLSWALFGTRIWTRVKPTFRLSLDDYLLGLAVVRLMRAAL